MSEFTIKDLSRMRGYSDVLSWNYVQIREDIRLFYKNGLLNGVPGDEKVGFEFCSLQINGWDVSDDEATRIESFEEAWNGQDVFIEFLYHGTAYFGGIRHIYLGTDETGNDGYINYPKILDHIEILKELSNLEDIYCRDIHDKYGTKI